MPRSASQAVGELFVPADQLSAVTAEAAALPAVEISKLDMEWVRADILIFFSSRCFQIEAKGSQ